MSRFVQVMPEPPDVYAGDPLLARWLHRHLDDGMAAAEPRLTALAADVAGPLRQAHHQAEAHPPELVRYDPWGARIDWIDTPDGWRIHRAAAVRHRLVALPYESRTRWGAGARVLQHALLHVYGPESATYSCPVAMSDGAAALLSHPDVDPQLRETWLGRLTAADPDSAITSGQWMTEASGGSDLSRSTTTADPAGDGSWRLTGDKWFCSAIDAEMAVALARPRGAEPGSRSLAPFLVPRYAAGSPLAAPGDDPAAPAPGVRVHRLKDKLGTRALPTAEVGLDGAYALPLGDPARSGLVRMMTLVRIARLHNAAAAAAGMRRGLAYAYAYAGARQVAGGSLVASPLHRATLGTLGVDAAGAFVLAAHAFALLGRVEVDGDADAAAELRIVAPVAKLATGKLAIAAAAEHLECFGGAGYVEDTGMPRLLRDAQVLPIWEGTTNVLSLDVLRAVVREDAGPRLLARVVAAGDGPQGLVAAEVTRLREVLAAVCADPAGTAVVAGARTFALRMAYALAAGLLASWDDDVAQVVADLWTRRWLAGQDISQRAHEHTEQLCATSGTVAA